VEPLGVDTHRTIGIAPVVAVIARLAATDGVEQAHPATLRVRAESLDDTGRRRVSVHSSVHSVAGSNIPVLVIGFAIVLGFVFVVIDKGKGTNARAERGRDHTCARRTAFGGRAVDRPEDGVDQGEQVPAPDPAPAAHPLQRCHIAIAAAAAGTRGC
jgi:hypothetical protein